MTSHDNQRGQICDALGFLTATGIVDYNGHVSLRHRDGGLLINTAGSNRAAISRDQICHVAANGELVSGERPPNEVHLHLAIMNARPDIQAVIHGHPKWSTLFTATGTPIEAVMPQGCLVYDIPVYDQPHSISNPRRGQSLADTLGLGPGALMKSHGCVFVGRDVIEASVKALYLEQNCERQYLARTLGRAAPFNAQLIAQYRETLNSVSLFKKCWDFTLATAKE